MKSANYSSVLLVLFVLLSLPVCFAVDCSESTSCDACTKEITCVWCTLANSTPPYEPYTLCVTGTPAGNHDNNNQCTLFYWAQCTISSQSIGDDYTYIISLVLMGVILIVIIGVIVTVARACRGKCNCCYRSKPIAPKPVGLKKTNNNKTGEKKPTTNSSATVKMNRPEDDELHRTLMRNCLDKMGTSTTVPTEVVTLREQQSQLIRKQQSTLMVAKQDPKPDPKPDTQQELIPHDTPEPVGDDELPMHPPEEVAIDVIDLVAESKKISDDLDEILRELAGGTLN